MIKYQYKNFFYFSNLIFNKLKKKKKKLKKYFYNEINHIYKPNNSNLNLEEFVKNNNYNV